jgi:transcription-repair coupling factor (superfamily II helicase)
MRDLELRGAGNMLGAEQHGHIAAVGFDTYCRILQESVQELQGRPPVEEKELRIDLPVKAFVPPGWVAQEALRLDLYRRISTAGDHEQLAAVRDETQDRYGALPTEVATLFAVASLRITAARLGVQEITTYKKEVRLTPVSIDDTLLLDLDQRVFGAGYHAAKRTLNLAPERVFGADLVRYVERWLLEAVGEATPERLRPEASTAGR